MAAAPRTIVVQGNGTNSLAFEVPAGVDIAVQAVYAAIDASAAGNTTAELTVTEQSGVVIAKKRQADMIPAGGSGSATWALRLDDGGNGSGIRYDVVNSGDWLDIHATTNLSPDNGGISLVANEGGVFVNSTGHAQSQFVVTADFVHFLLNNHILRVSDASLIELNTTDFEVISSQAAIDAQLGNFVIQNNWYTLQSTGSTSVSLGGPGTFLVDTGNFQTSNIGAVDIEAHAPGGTASTATIIGDDGVIISGGGSNGVKINANGHGVSSAAADVEVDLAAGKHFYVRDSGNAARLTVTESTGRTTLSVDGGSP